MRPLQRALRGVPLLQGGYHAAAAGLGLRLVVWWAKSICSGAGCGVLASTLDKSLFLPVPNLQIPHFMLAPLACFPATHKLNSVTC
jgi:hypothetical protein